MLSNNDKKTILVVEDEENIANIIKDGLEMSGFNVVTTRMVDEALQYLKDVGQIDAVWLDHYLLGLDGVEFVKKIRSENLWKDLPVFVVSNSEDDTKKKEYSDLGAIKYFTKADNELEDIIKEVKTFLLG